jgi:hypothetical protein
MSGFWWNRKENAFAAQDGESGMRMARMTTMRMRCCACAGGSNVRPVEDLDGGFGTRGVWTRACLAPFLKAFFAKVESIKNKNLWLPVDSDTSSTIATSGKTASVCAHQMGCKLKRKLYVFHVLSSIGDRPFAIIGCFLKRSVNIQKCSILFQT